MSVGKNLKVSSASSNTFRSIKAKRAKSQLNFSVRYVRHGNNLIKNTGEIDAGLNGLKHDISGWNTQIVYVVTWRDIWTQKQSTFVSAEKLIPRVEHYEVIGHMFITTQNFFRVQYAPKNSKGRWHWKSTLPELTPARCCTNVHFVRKHLTQAQIFTLTKNENIEKTLSLWHRISNYRLRVRWILYQKLKKNPCSLRRTIF